MAAVISTSAVGAVSVVWATGSGLREMATELLRAEVGRVVGIPARGVRLSRSCHQCGSSHHGRPVVVTPGSSPPLFGSLTRAGDLVVVVVSDCGPVGVDVEPLDAPRFAGFDDVALHCREVAPTIEARATTWVRKESLLKATGDGLRIDPRLIRLSDPDSPPKLVEWWAPGSPWPDLFMQDVEVEDHAACVTVLTSDTPRVTLRQAVPEELRR
jgi:4'-phosphopantetheinyl transferase